MKKRSKFGWLDFLLGVVLIAFGVYLFIRPELALSGAGIIFSVLAIISGIMDIVFFFRLKSGTGLGPSVSLITGIISILMGFMLLLNPVLGRWIFSIVFAIWFIAHSISRLANYKYIYASAGKAASIVSIVLNTLGVILGIMMFLSPMLSALSLGYLAAFALIVHGVGDVVEAFSKLGEEDGGEDEDGPIIQGNLS
ncbi:DUF308 domain-containing protein [Christensenellaceae bacterium OttesenSCG-928-M15]|nr:DUF308 domain-containing protein [Christensenellaceae bacterium OttesenSCG-928-M15]